MTYEVILVSFLSGGLAGGVVGAVVSHILAKGRESVAREFAFAMAKENRRLSFLAFMRSWRIDTVRHWGGEVAKRFESNLMLFESEVARILSDFDKATIEQFADSICSIRLSRIEQREASGKEPGKEELLAKINAFMEYVSAN